MNMKKQNQTFLRIFSILFLLGFATIDAIAQEESVSDANSPKITGFLETRLNFFQKDSTIDAFNTPQYDKTLYSMDSWLNLSYANNGFLIGLRFDVFNNSNLYSIRNVNTLTGIGYWQVQKKIKKFDITAGYIYDQIGRGIIFRSYELRSLAIDNALVGLRLVYDINDQWKIKFLGGKQKNQLTTYNPVLKGGSLEGFITLNKSGTLSIAPGVGAMARTWDDATANQLVSTVQLYHPDDSLNLYYNTYAYTIYNTLNFGNFNWYAEASMKTNDVLKDDDAVTTQFSGGTSTGKFVDKTGTNFYSSMSMSLGKFNISLEGKYTKNFKYRIDPFEKTINQGSINFLPAMSKQNTYALKNLYVPATQELGEKAAQCEIRYALNDQMGINATGSAIYGRLDQMIYNETDLEFNWNKDNGAILNLGFYRQFYDIELYQGKGGAPAVQTLTPYAEYLHPISDHKSARFELSYCQSKQGYGSLLYGLAEVSLDKYWTIFASDMWNFKPVKGNQIHYYSAGVFFNQDYLRISAAYIKQPEGVVCTGGICRIEPAFSGARLTINAQF